MSLVYFVVLIGVLIFVHEFGHFIFAKAFDVKVLRFSIGFGPRLIGFEYGETEYVVCALPLGGYVQMYGHTFESMENIDDEDSERALMGKPVWQRSLIALAGPAFNILLPLVIYFGATAMMTTAPPAIVGQVLPDTPAADAGLKAGDEIVSIEDRPIRYWHELTDVVKGAYNETITVTVRRDDTTETLKVTPEKQTRTDFLGLNKRTYGRLGIHRGTQGSTIAIDQPDGPAARSGLRHFDRVVAIEGESVDKFTEIQRRIRNSEGKPLEFLVLHRNRLDVSYAQFFSQEADTITVEPVRDDGSYTIGIDRAEMYVTEVDDGSPAAEAGLKAGDEVLSLNDRDYTNWDMMTSRIRNDIHQRILEQSQSDESVDVDISYELAYERGTETRTTTLTPNVIEYTGKAQQASYRIYTGWGHFSDLVMPDQVSFPLVPRLAYAAERSVQQTYEIGQTIVMGFVRMAQGRVSLDTVGGPIMIGELAAKAGRAGFGYFLHMMALISINLAILNLLPIPVLDGGHLMFYAIEAVRRRPLSFRTRQILTYIGFAIVVFLMILAFKNDIQRNWGDFVLWLESF
jgi:regulator of sigma E protease